MAAEIPVERSTPPVAGEGNHRCAAGRGCRDPIILQTPQGTQRMAAIIASSRGLCDRCRGAVAAAVHDLERDHEQLLFAVTQERTRGPDNRVSGTPTPPIPLDTRAEALARTLAEWAEVAGAMVAAELAIDPPTSQRARGHPRRDGRLVSRARGIVEPNLELLLAAEAQPIVVWDRDGVGRRVDEADGIDVALRLVWCHRQVLAMSDPDPRQRLAMPCPVFDCGAPTLGVSNGSTDVTCSTCGGRWTEREYQWLAGLLVADIQRDDEDGDMWEWLLAEARWQRDVAEWVAAEREFILAAARIVVIDDAIKLTKLRKVAAFTGDDVGSSSAMDIIALVGELVE